MDDMPLYKYFEKLNASNAVAGIAVDAEFQALVDGVTNINSDDNMKEFMVELFDYNCSVASIGCYFFNRIKVIESRYENDFEGILTKVEMHLCESDRRTFEIVQSTLIQLYREILNIQKGLSRNIHVSCARSTACLKYENGILEPLKVNSSQILREPNLIGRLLINVFTILNFYEALLRRAENPNEDKNAAMALRFIYYLMRMLLSETEHTLIGSTFTAHIAQIFFLLEIEYDSILLSNIDRGMHVEAHGDMQVIDTSNNDVMPCLYKRIIFKFHMVNTEFVLGDRVNTIAIFESEACTNHFIFNDEFKRAVEVDKTVLIIGTTGVSDLFTRLLLSKIVRTRPNLRLIAIQDGELTGVQMTNQLQHGVNLEYCSFN